MWPEFSTFVADDLPSKDKLSYLNFIRQNPHLELQDENDRRLVSATIETWISSPLTRYDGLVLWQVSLENSQLYINSWGILLRASLGLSASIRKIALKILNQMVLVFGATDAYKPAFERSIPEIMPSLLQDLEDNERFVLSCETLAVCMKFLPDMLGTHSVVIEAFLVKHLDNESVQVIEAIADCFAILPKCLMHYHRPKSTYSIAFADLYEKAVNTLQSLLEGILLALTGTIGPVSNDNKPMLIIPCDAAAGLSYLCHKVRVFSSLGRCLAKLICTETQKVQVYIEDILLLIRRVITFPEETEFQQREASFTALTYPKLSNVAFMLMEAIVLKFTVVEFYGNIMALTLKAIGNAQKASQNPLYHSCSEVRLSIYKFLNAWIKQSGCTVSKKVVSDNIIGYLLNDIAVPPQASTDIVLRKQTTIEALKVLNNIVKSASTFFEKKHIEYVNTSILKTVSAIQYYLHPLRPLPLPYSDDNCRVELYNLLLTCCVSEHPLQKNCIARSVNRYKLALSRDPSPKVTSLCRKSLTLFGYFLNPKKPPPDYMLPTRIVEENPIDQWECTNSNGVNWQGQQQHVNGQVIPENILPAPPLYPADGTFRPEFQDVIDNENNVERANEQVNTQPQPVYHLLGTASQCNGDFRSCHSSHSNGHETVSAEMADEPIDDDIDSSLEGPHAQVASNSKGTSIPRANKSKIQILETHSTTEVNAARNDEDSSEANVVRDTQSEQSSNEDVTPTQSPKRVAYDNAAMEESEEEEEGSEEDDEEYAESEGRYSPEPRMVKRQKFRVEVVSSEEEYNRPSAECDEEMGSNEEYKDEEEAVTPEVNGEEEGECARSPQVQIPSVEEMVMDFVLAEAVES